jgi:ubiquinone/menaquinone biosynthesis C-methylase UbiE
MDPFADYAWFYDLDYAGVDMDLPMIEQFAARSGSPILEVACGTGRVLLPLAQQGHRVVGVDFSAAMLDLARQKVRAAGLDERVTLVEQDMRQLELDRRFTMAFVVSNSFLALTTLDDQLTALTRIRQHLNPGGLLLLDLFNPDLSRLLDVQGRVTLDKVVTDPQTGQTVQKFLTQSVDLGEQLINTTLIIDRMDGSGWVQRTLFPFTLRYLFRGELELLLRHTGFAVEAIYGSYDLDEYCGESERIIAVARRSD